MNTPRRPTLLSVGIVLQALHAVFAGFLYLLGGGLAAGLFGASLAALPIFGVFPLNLLAAFGALFLLTVAAFYGFVLFVCWRAWEGERPWLWTLIVLSIIGLVNTGPISVLVGVMTIVGAWQFLQELDEVGAPAA